MSYRLNLARALAWGERFAEAERELARLADQQPGNAAIGALQLTVRMALKPPSHQAARWLAGEPRSTEYRRILARALTRAGRFVEALAQYDTLLRSCATRSCSSSARTCTCERRDHAAAETDPERVDRDAGRPRTRSSPSATCDAGVATWAPRTRSSAGRATSLRASHDVAAAFARLARDERPAAAFIPQASDGPGWQTTSAATSDNLGALLTTVTARRGFETRAPLEGSAGVKVIRLSDRFVTTASSR